MSIYAAASGMILEQRRQEIIARNLAASGISGYKREYLTSHDFKADLSKEIMQNTNRFQGTTGGKVQVDLSQGALKATHDPLDFAISGIGFFEVESPTGRTLYTRNGEFTLSADGMLITKNGDVVQGVNGPIQFTPDMNLCDVCVSPDGEITVDTHKEGEEIIKSVGTLKIMTTDDSSILKKISSSDFIVKDDKDQPKMFEIDRTASNFSIINNHLELSNASPIKDMVSMIRSMREFEMGQKMLRSLDEIGKQARAKLG